MALVAPLVRARDRASRARRRTLRRPERDIDPRRRATTVAGVALVAVFFLQWKGFVPDVFPAFALLGPAILLFVYPELDGPVG